MAVRSVRSPPLRVSAEGSDKLDVAGAFKLLGSYYSGGSGAAVGFSVSLGELLIVDYVSMAVAELEGDMPVVSHPDRPASSIDLWPDGPQVKSLNVHITNVRCCIERYQKDPQPHGLPGPNARSTAGFVEALQPLMPERLDHLSTIRCCATRNKSGPTRLTSVQRAERSPPTPGASSTAYVTTASPS